MFNANEDSDALYLKTKESAQLTKNVDSGENLELKYISRGQ